MTNEEFINKISDMPLPVIATGLLKLENERESAFGKACKEAELAELKSAPLTDEERRKQFGARVRMMRQLLGLTQVELAAKLGATPQALSFYEQGTREAPFRNLVGLARALNVTTDWLLDTKSPPLMQ